MGLRVLFEVLYEVLYESQVLCGPQVLICMSWSRLHHRCKMWHWLEDSQLRSTITFDHG